MRPRAGTAPGWAAAALVAANAVPLLGVAFWGWRTFDLLLLYWLENVAIGAFTLLRMVTVARPERATAGRGSGGGRAGGGGRRPGARRRHEAPGGDPHPAVGGLLLAPFFAAHYGAFLLVHGMIVAGLFAREPSGAPPIVLGADAATFALEAFRLAAAGLRDGTLALPAAMLLASHAVEYVAAFLRDPRERALSPSTWMARPYGRVLALHGALVVGGVLVAGSGDPLPALALLVVGKTALDLAAQAWARRRRGARAGG